MRYTCTRCKHRYYSVKSKPCSKCSEPVSKDTKIWTYRAFSHLEISPEGKDKKRSAMQYKDVIEHVKSELSCLHISEAHFQLLRRRMYDLWLKKRVDLSTQRKKIRTLISKLEGELAGLERKKMAESEKGGDVKGVTLAINSVNDEIDQLEDQLGELRDQIAEEFEMSWNRLQVLRDARKVFGEDTGFEPKKHLILSLVSNLKFYDKSIEVIWHEPYARLVKNAKEKAVDKNSGGAGPTACLSSSLTGSPGWIRTNDPLINSQLLYH